MRLMTHQFAFFVVLEWELKEGKYVHRDFKIQIFQEFSSDRFQIR